MKVLQCFISKKNSSKQGLSLTSLGRPGAMYLLPAVVKAPLNCLISCLFTAFLSLARVRVSPSHVSLNYEGTALFPLWLIGAIWSHMDNIYKQSIDLG